MEETAAPQAGSSSSRLLIQKMVLENFKSYGGVREIGPFHKRFSAIVGPNGSGKSNVIDAMLFVFGKRAKKLRLNKVSELIHKSDLFPDVDCARVSVHFCDAVVGAGTEREDEYEIVPGSEVVVTRVALANNQSRYTIDGASSTFGEVGELLRRRGVDLDNNRFLILQGEVEQIAMMKPKAASQHEDGLLEYLEDIIGSNSYVEAIEEAEKVVDATCEARLEKLNRLKVSEKEVASLEDAKTEAEAFVVKEDAIRRERCVLYQAYAHEAGSNVSSLTERHGDLRTRQGEAAESRASVEADAATSVERVEGLRKAHATAARASGKAREAMVALERREIELKEEAKHRKATAKKLEATVARETKDAARREADIEAAKAAEPELRQRLDAAEKDAARAEEVLSAARDEARAATAAVRRDLEVAQRDELAPAKARLGDAESSVDAATAEIEALERGPEAARAELETVAAKLEVAARSAARCSAELSRLDERAEALGSRSAALERELRGVATTEETSRAAAREALAAVEARHAKTRQREEAMAAKGVVPPAIRDVLAASRRGGELASAGVRGRLGDLGSIASDYDVAISTACDLLDHVVVETGAGGQRCIEFLRKHKLGRASFVVLDELGQWRDRARKQPQKKPPPGRLFDLVAPESDEYAPAFYMALRETLVAKNLDAAVQLAYARGERKRVVTLGGQLIDASGTMSGGGGKPKSGKMRLQGGGGGGGGGKQQPVAMDEDEDDDANDVEELERRAEAASAEANRASQHKQRVESELHAVRRDLEEIVEVTRPRLEAERRAAAATNQRLETRAETLRRDATISAEAAAALQASKRRRDELASSVAPLRAETERSEAKVEGLRRAVLEAGGPVLKRATAEADEAIAAVDDAKAALSETDVALKAATKALAKSRTAKAKAERDLAALAEATDDLSDVREQTAAAKAAFDSANDETNARAADLADQETKLADLKSKANELKANEVDLQNQIDDYARAIKENKTKNQHWLKELGKLRADHRKEVDAYPDVLTRASKAKCQDAMDEGDDDGENDDRERETEEEVVDPRVLRDLSAEKLEAQDKEDLKYRIALLEAERDAQRANVNLETIDEYEAKSREYEKRLDELAVVTEARNKARDHLESLRRKRLEDFMCGFGQIALKLKENYQLLTLGGDAELELVDSLDPFSEGVVFSVRPPKKSWKNISNLSGGEKTLSSLALVFALHHYKPTPLYVMDEIDAALDFKNVSIIANYIKERCKSAQFIIISLRNNMFELADRLVGIYKVNQCTRTVCISPDQFALRLDPDAEVANTILRDTTNVGAQVADAY
ncbi:hypothetical protein CTAYLR_006472 [Chrysophaeum taylorii]|uniref:Structural maintenance of chromosomes protein n=1 Tax=Chrysophaeum taylorii TaxID=2483200 RepID=A0AAD7UKZ5_9STRA|nr:hypothetical protein CTAYLR_006472 [Chrysophaeum taylorii]